MAAGKDLFVERTACPACGQTGAREVFRCPYDDEPIKSHLVTQYAMVGTIDVDLLAGAVFTIAECEHCGLLYHPHVPGDELMALVYDRWIDPARARRAHKETRDVDARMRFAREIMLADGRLREAGTPLKVLDFGMGWGAWCTMARALGCDAWGHESSPERMAHAKENGIPLVAWDDLPGQRFQLVNAEQVFEHLVDPYATLVQLEKALAPGGLLKLSVPDCRDLKKRLAKNDWAAMDGPNNLLAITPLQHVNGFDREALVTLAARAGFRPASLTLGELFAANADVARPKNLLGAITRPIGRRFFADDTYVFFERAGSAVSVTST